MFYNELSESCAIKVIKEIIEYASSDSTAVELIELFIDNVFTMEEIENKLF